jgi:hypothetical protein
MSAAHLAAFLFAQIRGFGLYLPPVVLFESTLLIKCAIVFHPYKFIAAGFILRYNRRSKRKAI